MLKKLMKIVLGDKQARDIKRLMPVVTEINEIFEELQDLPDEELRNKTTEFRRMLGVTLRTSRVGEQFIVHEQAEEHLKTHPDVERAAFVGTRRDCHPGDVVAWVKLNEDVKADNSSADSMRAGMGRLGEGYKPRTIVVVDEFPTYEDERGRPQISYHKLSLATEQNEFGEFENVKWADIEAKLQVEEDTYDLEDIMPEAFAILKEVCRRHLGQEWDAAGAHIKWEAVPYDVQLMGAVALAEGNIAEMATGEGKTLTAIFPLYLRALMGKGAHLVTVNDYLARRDAEWNQPLFSYLGMTVGCIDKTDPHTPERRAIYACDIVYGTTNEFGFDYLRDNMAVSKQQLVQRDLFYAIVDEVDSTMIDEARTPLIISGPVDRSTDQYDRILPQIRALVGDQNKIVSEKARQAEQLLEEDPASFEAGLLLLQCYKGSPKHVRYNKLRQEPRIQRLQDKVEMEMIRLKKMPEVEEELYFTVDEKIRATDLTDKGRIRLNPDNPEYFVLGDIVDEFAAIEQDPGLDEEEKEKAKHEARMAHDQKSEELHTINQLLHAYVLKQKDVDYVVEEDKVVIVDEFTGRKMPGRRWSDGLHQAVEAKEGVKVEKETQTLATITIQNYFRMYEKLAGMTGTAETERAEFAATYQMDVIVIPTNRPIVRADMDDLVFMTKRDKFKAVLDEIERLNKLQLPILVGTASVQTSETLSRMLRSRGHKHNVLNAKNHQSEAQIIAGAGQPGAITIATNMAGRGTDIKLGAGVKEPRQDPETGEEWPGGLQIVGTERHEARRIDRQLRGRSGRQGDPGTSRFLLSLEDDLLRWYGGERLAGWMSKLGVKEGEAIVHPWVTRSIEKAQKKVEEINQTRRKHTLQYDDIMNKQRGIVYGLRREFLIDEDPSDSLIGVFEDALEMEFQQNYGDPANMGDADIHGWLEWIERTIVTENLDDLKERSWPVYEELHQAVVERLRSAFEKKCESLEENTIPVIRYIGVRTIDDDWQDHLLAMDDLRESVGMRSYGQKDPLVEYTRDSTILFNEYMQNVNRNIFERFFRAAIMSEDEARERQRVQRMQYMKAQAEMQAQQAAAQQTAQQQEEVEAPTRRPKSGLTPYRRDMPKVGRNDPCPCGSGKKYKHCHGAPGAHEPLRHTVGNPQPEEE